MNWLFLRGYFDRNNERSLREDSDFWLQLFESLVDECDNPQEANGCIYYHGYKQKMPLIYNGCLPVSRHENVKDLAPKFDYVFARGGHPEYEPILKACKNAFKIYYGAGRRIIPEKDLGYNLILCDTERQVEKCKKKYPHIRAELWIKPAAKHFKPVECKKEYDVCYVADCHSKFQKKIKNVKWTYKNLPKDLTMLHLGKSSIKSPSNITVKKVPRIDMHKWINKCRVGIVSYTGYDSAPRALIEMIACGLRVYLLPSVNIAYRYIQYSPSCFDVNCYLHEKNRLWPSLEHNIKNSKRKDPGWHLAQNNQYRRYMKYYSIKPAAEHLRKLICGERTT